MSVRLDFGKHRGKDLRDVPANYLRWVWENLLDLDWRVRDAVRRELESRGEPLDGPTHCPAPADWSGIITRWHRELTLRWHPDRGGDTRVMQALNDAVDRLREMVKAG